MELSWLEDFLALAELSHFSNAANRRNISQPAFSRRIKLLEEWIGTPLFTRNTYSVELTVAGKRFRQHASEVARRIAIMREDTRAVAGLTEATLRFASTNHLSAKFFPNWLRTIEADQGDRDPVRLISDTSAGCTRLLSDGLVDFMLCFHHPALTLPLRTEHFAWVDVGADTLIPVSAPESAGASTPLHALPGGVDRPVPYLSFLSEAGIGGITKANLLSAAAPTWLKSTFYAQMATVLVEVTRSGRGVAWLPASLVKPDLESGALVPAGSEWDIPVLIRLWRHRASRSQAVERFWERVQATFAV